MRKTIFIIFLALLLLSIGVKNVFCAEERSGYILLQVEDNGEAWYVHPQIKKRYYLGRPADAFEIMKKFALGAKHDFIIETEIFPSRLSGTILLDVEKNGEAYYIYPKDLKKHYLGRPADAFRVMQELGQGISTAGLEKISTGNIEDNILVSTAKTGKILLDVPFTPQSPFGDWADQRQQDGCEEASSLMAIKWARDESLTYEEALDEILVASDYSLRKYGEYRDIAVPDIVEWIIKDYFNYQNVTFKTDISIEDIVDELSKGNVVITPMNGQLLGNPYYTAPGPERHMILIRGYDEERKVFITNDPGTRRGEGFEYDEEMLFNAIRSYPTGYHEPIEKIEKDMIIVWK